MIFPNSVLIFLFCNAVNANSSLPGGQRRPPGLFTSLTIFVRRRGVLPKPEIEGEPADKSMHSDFLCSGTILSPRWVLTKAKPLVYYSYKEYFMITESDFAPSDLSSTREYVINWLEFYNKFEKPDDLEYDVALAHVNQEIEFSRDLRAVNLGVTNPRTYFKNCHLIVWEWPRELYSDAKVRKVIIPVQLRNGDSCDLAKVYAPGDYSLHFACLVARQKGKFVEPCAVNIGAPVVCDFQELAGLFIGRWGRSACTASLKDEQQILDIYADDAMIFRWIKLVFDNVNIDDNFGSDGHMETGYLEYDVVFVRTTSGVVLSQSVRPVNVGMTGVTIPYPDDAQDCRLLVWNFTKITTRSDKGLTMIHPAEIPIRFPADCRNGDKNYTDYNLYMNCIKQNLSESAFPFDQPCAMNLGAPVVCGIFQQLWGVFVGDDGISRCTGESFRGNDGEKEYDMINVHKPDEGYPIQNFIEVILNKAVYVNNLGEVLEHFNISADSGGKLDK